MTVDTIDESFMWNSYMMSELIQFRSRLPQEEKLAMDKAGFLTTAIRGFAGTTGFKLGSKPAYLTIISRQSCKRAGTRFNARGVDDDGQVANFVETETVFCLENELCFGYTQIRGSVPVFWEQDANLLSAKLTITRSLEATQPAFDKHFEGLQQRFGPVHVVNLLAAKNGEVDLSNRFKQHIDAAVHHADIGLTKFDFHAEVAHGGYSMASKIIPRVQDVMKEFGFYSYDPQTAKDETEQVGVFRTNCLDCLDRTNMVQQLLSREALDTFLAYHGVAPGQDIWIKHNSLWADNGDQLSQIYAGTNALKTSYTRSGKMGLVGAISDVTKSVGRMYINNFVDKGRQNTMDVLLGKGENQLQVVLHDPINDFVTTELNRRRNEYSSTRQVTMFSGTFNLNGKMSDTDLTPWLFAQGACDMYLIGFQEVVDMTAGQILNADPAKRDFWEKQVNKCLNKHGQYVLLRSGQLVGTALFLFVRKEEVGHVKQVEGSTKKTGLGGMAGNKGGVAVSFNYNNTSFCFVTAHLASGLNNVDERHSDYKVLSSGLRFSRGRRIKDHDCVVWVGDFNYRVSLPNDQVRKCITRQDIATLLERDQLNRQMVKGETFPYYNEAPITFLPTYKFDNGTDNYDTSEKARIPAWTDRILSRGSNLKQLSYGSAPLLFSDHRPVYATFLSTLLVIDDAKKHKLSQELYNKRRAEVGSTNEIVNLIDLNENMLTHGLPPPSSDTKKWWISGGQAAKVGLNPPGPDMVINSAKDANPFAPQSSAAPDFVSKPQLPPRPPTFSTPPLVPERPNSSAIPASSSSKRSPPPLVPKKPASLRQPTPEIGGTAARAGNLGPQASVSPPPPPPPPRGSRSRSRASSTSTTGGQSVASGSSKSLIDDGGEALKWTPLQPQ